MLGEGSPECVKSEPSPEGWLGVGQRKGVRQDIMLKWQFELGSDHESWYYPVDSEKFLVGFKSDASW